MPVDIHACVVSCGRGNNYRDGIGSFNSQQFAVSGARVTQSLLYGLKAHDPLTVGLAVALLAAVSLCASLLPALRASRLDPIDALREE